GFFTGDRLDAVETVNLGADRLEADNFILASGSFFSHGLTALSDGVSEPVFGLDVEAAGRRADWFDKDLFRPQPFMKFGVATDAGFRALRGGRPVENMRVAGAILSGADSVAEGSGAGVALATAMAAANAILKD
ncbi:MAG: FAD-binding protein, partial [Muribaculaceae bacterium]